MNGRHAICLVVDGLRAAALGAYGNTSFPTPHLDALASQSVVVDWLWADSPLLPNFYRSVWQGLHAMRSGPVPPRSSIPQVLNSAGVRQWLVTDDSWLIERSTELPFDKTLLLETHAEQPAATIAETAIAQLCSETVLQLNEWYEGLSEEDSGSLLWLHTRGLMGPWDAPTALRKELLEVDDPEPLELVKAPELLRDIEDPDVLHAYRVAYAAQVSVLDACVGAFCDAIAERFAVGETLVMLIGSQGWTLGEHGAIGSDCTELFGERLHLPWLLHVCGRSEPLQRHPALAQPADVGATLLDWFGQQFPQADDGQSILPMLAGRQCTGRQIAVTQGLAGEQVLRTPSWQLRKTAASDSVPVATELYVKPDDRWECNDVASRCAEVVVGLCEEMDRFAELASTGQPLPKVPAS
ncbi:MAG: sulfatase-like hydrolase/transferase [Pirellulales bacterium]|nr:sulfatase-like hydrolase/transferase [Pirellulales bacterium]